jgi:hypothetical protein
MLWPRDVSGRIRARCLLIRRYRRGGRDRSGAIIELRWKLYAAFSGRGHRTVMAPV